MAMEGPQVETIWEVGLRKRNTNRGIRSEEATARRRIDRNVRKLVSRRRKRAEAQELTRGLKNGRIKLSYGKTINFAYQNICGGDGRGIMVSGKRENIEYYMNKNNIDIMLLGETRCQQTARERKKNYTWYFSGTQEWEEKVYSNTKFPPSGSQEYPRRNYAAGVAIVIRNSLMKTVLDIEPKNSRMMVLTLNSTLPITIIGTYMPTADHHNVIKLKYYEELYSLFAKHKSGMLD